MSIPRETTVLIVGGGPGGSYTASALVREGVSCVVLEADRFPRYHVGESMLPSMRHFLRFIELDETFLNHGFRIKTGAAFKLNDKPVGFTDFVAHGGAGNHSWNVLREEADDLMFKHAGKCGAEVFDGVKVNSIEFVPPTNPDAKLESGIPDPGRPVSASWSRKDGSSGQIKFDYLVDASGRAGIVSTKYLKNRKNNQGLKNIANWGYWKGAEDYAPGTNRQGQPLFEALSDASGWCWYIPLHNGTTSVGVVQNQELAMTKKKAMEEPSTKGFYLESTKLAPGIREMLAKAELASEIKGASDWSYNASCYATPNLRIVGDAGCFIDPYFSSGVHLALSGALSAATTIRAAMRGDCDETAAVKWHSAKVSEGYTRFLLVVLSALKQIRQQDKPILSDWDEEGFETAFAHFRPIIQGTADVSGKLSQEEVSKTVDFCLNAFEHHSPEKQAAVMKKMETAMLVENVEAPSNLATTKTDAEIEKKAKVDPEGLSEDELKILNTIRARQMLRREDTLSIDNFSNDAIHGLVPVVKRGSLGLMKSAGKTAPKGPARGQPAAEQPVVEQPTMEQPVADKPEMEQPVVEQPKAEQPTVEQPTVEQPVVEQPTTEQPVVDKPSVEQPAMEQPNVEQPTVEQPTVEQPAVQQPTVEQPVVELPTVEQTTVEQPAIVQPAIDQPMMDQPAVIQPTIDQPMIDQPMIDQPAIDQPAVIQPTIEQPTIEKTATVQPTIEQPMTEQPVTDQPMLDQPATDQPTKDQKETDQPMSDQPTMDTPPLDKFTDSLPTAITV